MDFRDLNRATPKDEYPMPVAETLINAAAGHKMMSENIWGFETGDFSAHGRI